MHDCVPKVVAIAVRMVMMMLRTLPQMDFVSFPIRLEFGFVCLYQYVKERLHGLCPACLVIGVESCRQILS